MRNQIFDGDTDTRQRLQRLIHRGEYHKALRMYEMEKVFVETARTHLLALIVCREGGFGSNRMTEIEDRAKRCKDYERERLNFARERAVYHAQVDRNFSQALQEIDEVIRRRHESKEEDRAQLPADELARCRILLLDGDVRSLWRSVNRLKVLHADSVLYNRHSRYDTYQTQLDTEWWYFVAVLRFGKDAEARRVATASLQTKADPNPKRQRLWRVVSTWKRIGPKVARLTLKRQLGL